jgi:hypothetical protein
MAKARGWAIVAVGTALDAAANVASGMVTQHWEVAEWVAVVLFAVLVIAQIWVNSRRGPEAPPSSDRVAGRPDYASGISRGKGLPAARHREDGHAGNS